MTRQRVLKDGCEIIQPEDQKRVQIWKDGRMIRELTTSKKDLKYNELMDILTFYIAMEDLQK